MRVMQGIEGLPLFVTPDLYVAIPEHLTAYTKWHTHALTDPSSSKELHEFIELASGKTAFIDIGAQTGFLSAVFSRLTSAPGKIASIEPDPQVREALSDARDLNEQLGVDWEIIHAAVSDVTGEILLPACNTVFDKGIQKTILGEPFTVASTTLEDLVKTLGWEPDIIKIDVESYEHEILNSSWKLLERLRPALQLEVHWEILQSRGLNGIRTMECLHELGYRGMRRGYHGIDQWKRQSTRESVSRFSLRIQ